MQGFTFLWLLDNSYVGQQASSIEVDAEAAAATMHSMSCRLTDLAVPNAGAEIVAAIQRAGPALAQSLSSLKINIDIFNPQHDFHLAAQTLWGISAGLQHVELGVVAPDLEDVCSAAEVQAADAAFAQLIRSLPSCQHLHLYLGSCISLQAARRALLQHAPHLRSVRVASVREYKQVSSHHATVTRCFSFQIRCFRPTYIGLLCCMQHHRYVH
jgi:hypothetical protein